MHGKPQALLFVFLGFMRYISFLCKIREETQDLDAFAIICEICRKIVKAREFPNFMRFHAFFRGYHEFLR